MSTFQGLAQEAVEVTIVTLKQASQMLAQLTSANRTLAAAKEPGGTLVAPMAPTIDSLLFLIKHLLILREQVAAFECDLVTKEKYLDFSNVWDALRLRVPVQDPRRGGNQPNAILGASARLIQILTPKLQESHVDSKRDIEAELKSACEALIANQVPQIAGMRIDCAHSRPLSRLDAAMGCWR